MRYLKVPTSFECGSLASLLSVARVTAGAYRLHPAAWASRGREYSRAGSVGFLVSWCLCHTPPRYFICRARHAHGMCYVSERSCISLSLIANLMSNLRSRTQHSHSLSRNDAEARLHRAYLTLLHATRVRSRGAPARIRHRLMVMRVLVGTRRVDLSG